MAEVQTYTPEEFASYLPVREARQGKVVLSRVIRYKRRVAEAVLDFGAICACWIGANLLRYNGDLALHAHDLGTAFPYMVSCQLGAFYASGLYRNSWRFVTSADIVAIVRAVVCAAAVLWLLLHTVASMHRVSYSLLGINAVLLLLVVVGMRLAFKLLRFHFAVKRRQLKRPVLVLNPVE